MVMIIMQVMVYSQCDVCMRWVWVVLDIGMLIMMFFRIDYIGLVMLVVRCVGNVKKFVCSGGMCEFVMCQVGVVCG